MIDSEQRNERIREGLWFLNEAIEHYRQHRHWEASAAAEIASASFAAVHAVPSRSPSTESETPLLAPIQHVTDAARAALSTPPDTEETP